MLKGCSCIMFSKSLWLDFWFYIHVYFIFWMSCWVLCICIVFIIIIHYGFLTMGLHLNRFFCNGLLYWIQTKPIFAVISIYFRICKPVLYPNNKPFTCFCKVLLRGLITNFLQTMIISQILTLLIWFFLQIKAH